MKFIDKLIDRISPPENDVPRKVAEAPASYVVYKPAYEIPPAKEVEQVIPTAEVIQREVVHTNDLLQKQMTDLLAGMNKPENLDQAQRMARLGFTAARAVKDTAEHVRALERAERLRTNIQKAKERYPAFKFVAEEVMTEVCEKYGLIIGSADRYKGDVPAWVMDILERSGVPAVRYRVRAWKKFDGMPDGIKKTKHGQWGDSYYEWDADSPFSPPEAQGVVYNTPTSLLTIAAPAPDMEVRQNERVVNGRITVSDPIVCVKVSGGYVVLAAWGEEGQDPRVFNADNN